MNAPATPLDAAVNQGSLAGTIALHLLPGAFVLTVYLPLTPLALRRGIPPLLVLLVAGCVGMAFQLGHLILLAGGWRKLPQAIPNWRKGKRWHYVVLVPVLVILGVAAASLSFLDQLWSKLFFSWVPTWFLFSNPKQYAAFGHSILLVTFSARLLLDGLVIPVIEELYFRGYLLPRMSGLGWGAPWLNAALFSVYHFWQPFNLPTLFLLSLPLSLAVWKTKNVRVSLFTHLILNLLGSTATLATLLAHPGGFR